MAFMCVTIVAAPPRLLPVFSIRHVNPRASHVAPFSPPPRRSRWPPAARPRPSSSPAPTDIRIVEVTHAFEEFHYRAPYQFGGRSVDRVTLLNVRCRVRTGGGREAWGFGSMTLGNAWAFPAASQEAGLGAMKALAGELRARDRRLRRTRPSRSICSAPSSRSTCAPPPQLSRARALPVPIPKLCTLVVASAFDAAVHDALRQGVRRQLLRDLRPARS